METIEWKDFEKVHLIAGTIVEAEHFPEARRPAYKLKVDLGSEWGLGNLLPKSPSSITPKSL